MTATHPNEHSNTQTINPWEQGDHAMLNNQPVTVIGIDGTRCHVQRVDETDMPLPDTLPETVNMDALSPRKQWPDRPAPRNTAPAPMPTPKDPWAIARAKVLAEERAKLEAALGDSAPFQIPPHDQMPTSVSEWQVGSKVLAYGNQHGYVLKSEDDKVYVEMKSGAREWVPCGSLALIALPTNMPILPKWIVVGTDAQNDFGEVGVIRGVHWTPKSNEWLITFETKKGIEDLLVKEITPLQQTPAPTITLHPADPLTLDQASESTIAQEEIDAAQMANKLGEKIAERDATIKDLEARLRVATEATMKAFEQRDGHYAENKRLGTLLSKKDARIQYLEGELASADARNDRIVISQSERAPHRPIETTTKRNITDKDIADLINAGWRVVFEDVYIQPGNASHTHLIRFEREIIDVDTPPQDEAHAFVVTPSPTADPMPYAEDHAPDESGVVVEHAVPAEIVFHVTPMISPQYEPIDPRDIDVNLPTRELLSKYRVEDVIAAKDQVIMNAVAAMKQRYEQIAQQPVRTLAQALQQHA